MVDLELTFLFFSVPRHINNTHIIADIGSGIGILAKLFYKMEILFMVLNQPRTFGSEQNITRKLIPDSLERVCKS